MRKFFLALLILTSLFACKNDQANTTSETAEVKQEVSEKPVKKAPVKRNNTQNIPYNYVGDFSGTIPCNDCEGRKINLRINDDKTYKLTENFLGKNPKSATYTGSYTIDNMVIHIKLDNGEMRYYYIVNQGYYVLNEKKQQIAGSQKELYKLNKQAVK